MRDTDQARDDGLVDVEGRPVAVRGFEISSQWRGTVPAGGHSRDLWIRLTIDTTLRIHAIEARTDRVPGGPARAAQAVLQLVDSRHPPVHLLPGLDALRAAREKLVRLGQEYDRWESISNSTNAA